MTISEIPIADQLKAVLIDLDGTLADSVPALKNVYFEFLRLHGHVGSNEEFEELVGPSLPEILEILRSRYEIALSKKTLFEQYMRLLIEAYKREVLPTLGAEYLLYWLMTAKISIVLVTSAPSALAENFLHRYGWSKYFSFILTGDQVAVSKPDPAIYTTALKALGVSAQSAIAIEDSPSGVLAGAGASLRVIGVASEKEQLVLSQAGAFMTLPDLVAVQQYLERLIT